MKNKLLLLVIMIMAISCNKEKETQFHYLDQHTKDHFYFRNGSYWIYRDSLSGRVDSFYVTNSNIALEGYSSIKPPKDVFEHLILTLAEQNETLKDSINWNFDIAGNYITIKYNKNNQILTSTLGKFYEFQSLYLHYYGGGMTNLYCNSSTAISIGPNKFENVWGISFTDSFATNSYTKYSTANFYNDSVGFIKFRINYVDGKNVINEIWELQRWHIVK